MIFLILDFLLESLMSELIWLLCGVLIVQKLGFIRKNDHPILKMQKFSQ